jgi:hypothetical protein
MTTAYTVLIVDSNPSDRGLAALLLERELPDVTIAAPGDPMALAHLLVTSAPQVAIVAAEHAWSSIADMMTLIRRHHPATAVLIYGHESDIVARVLNPGLVCDGLVRKSSAGFLSLSTLVNQVRARAGFAVPAAPPISAPAPAVPVAAAAPVVVSHAPPPTPTPTPTPPLTPVPALTPMPVTAQVVSAPSASVVAPPVVPAMSSIERGNHEMRDIAMMFSHDLREPLQQILRLAARVELGDSDSMTATQTVPRLLECASRASNMLDGMLGYLDLAARDTTPIKVDLNVCLRDALDNLASAIHDSGAEISADPLPFTTGDEYQLVHLFQNLLSNAIKFRGRDRPRIRVTAEPQGNHWLLKFRDNGIGIAQPFTERVFEMGQRLHTREEYPGLGIGLALCRRIVERHGGLIWVESGDASGSTFCVLLPTASAD